MFLKDKTAIIYGGGGAIGGAAAKVFAREGARVFLAGRTRAKLDAVASDIAAAGGTVEVAAVDALDEAAVERHADTVAALAGGIDIALNAVGIVHVQGTPFADLSLDDFAAPVAAYTRTVFVTAKAVSRHMAKKRLGRLSHDVDAGLAAAGHGLSRLRRCLCGEGGDVAPAGRRTRPERHPRDLFAAARHSGSCGERLAQRRGLSPGRRARRRHGGRTARRRAGGTLLKRLPTLSQVAEVAAFMASDRAGAMTGTIANMTCGALVD